MSLSLFDPLPGETKEQREKPSALATEFVGARVGLHRCPILPRTMRF